MKLNYTISTDFIGQRLDSVVSSIIGSCTRNRAAALIKSADIRINDETKKPGYRVRPGDTLSGEIPGETGPEINPEPIPLSILHEDDHIIVINKAPGMVVHPAPGNMTGTLVNALLSHCGDSFNVQDSLREGIVHRLDKDTSGVMVAAKHRTALNFLQREFKYRRVEKRYLAVVTGVIAKDNGCIDLPIGRHSVKRKIMSTFSPTGKPAITLWQVRYRGDGACLVEAELKTGRTHQIRVHFKALGHPLVGDTVYGARIRRQNRMGNSSVLLAERQMLHAWKLCFRHPWSGKRVCFCAPPPPDFQQCVGLIGMDPAIL